MLKRAITYESFDGETVTEDFYFHISKAELTELELSKFKQGGMESSIKRMLADRDGRGIMEELKKIILMSVGRKSEDGRRFVKTDAIRDDFLHSPAYEVIFMELVTDATKAAAFIAACIPGNIDVEDLQAKSANVFDTPQPDDPGPERVQPEPKDPTALERREHPSDTAARAASAVDSEGRRVLTKAEVVAMPQSELSHLLATGQAVIGQD